MNNFLRFDSVAEISRLLDDVTKIQESGDDSGAKKYLNARCQQALGLQVSQIQRMSPEEIKELLNTAGGLRQTRAVMLAEILLRDAQLNSNDQAQVTIDRVHAFCLLSDNIDQLSVEVQSIYKPKLCELADQLGRLSSNPYIEEKLTKWEDHAVRF